MAEGEEGERMGREEVKIDAKRAASFDELHSIGRVLRARSRACGQLEVRDGRAPIVRRASKGAACSGESVRSKFMR